MLDPEFYWETVASCSPFVFRTLVDPIEQLWIDGHSTHHGRSDKIPIESIGETPSSLRLVGVERLVLRVFAPGEMFGNSKRRVQGRFDHASQSYALSVTEPVYERRYPSKLDGTYNTLQHR